MRLFWKLLLGSVALLLGSALLASLLLIPNLVLFPSRAKPFPDRPSDKEVFLEFITIQPAEGITLKGFSMTPRNAAKSMPTLILLHGVSSSKESYLDFAKELCSRGFRVMAFDSRGHGQSEGGCCTYGWQEKHDVSLIIDLVRATDPSSPIGIFGNSLGGAIALQAMANDPRIKCGVIESTFADFSEAACLRAPVWTKIRIDPFVYAGLWRASLMADWKPFQISPETSALAITQPVLLIHGTADDVFPISHGERIFKNLQSPDKEWLPVEGGGHHGLGKTYGPGYEKRLIDFYRKWLVSVPMESGLISNPLK